VAADDEGFEQWTVKEGGSDAVVEMIAELRHQVDAGLLPGFTDKDECLAHIRRQGCRSA
jgi:hypothetical protein